MPGSSVATQHPGKGLESDQNQATWENMVKPGQGKLQTLGLEKIEDSAIDPIWVLGKFIHASGWPSAFPKQFIKDFSIVSGP